MKLTGYILSILLATVLWAEPVGVPWTLQGLSGSRSGFLTADAPARLETDDSGTYLAAAAPPGQQLAVKLGAEDPVPLQALHMYQISVRLRCPARMRVWLQMNEQAVGLEQETWAFLPAPDYVVAPIWEDLTAFLIVPAGPAGRSLILNVSNAANGREDWSVGLRDLRFQDLGIVQKLDPPRVIGQWPRVVLNERLNKIPAVIHDGGSGLYRVRATIDSPQACSLGILLEQGDDPVFHWWRSSGGSQSCELPAGTSQIERVFHVADRRFVHQWLRLRQQVTTPPVVVRDLELVQIAKEPPAAAEAGLQTPSRR